MSAHKMSEVYCNICFEGEREWHVSISQLRAQLKEQGWKRRKDEDICPRCLDNGS